KTAARTSCSRMLLMRPSPLSETLRAGAWMAARRPSFTGAILPQQTVAVRVPLVDRVVHTETRREFRIGPARPLLRSSPGMLQHFLQPPGDNLFLARRHHPCDDGHAQRRPEGDDAGLSFLKRLEAVFPREVKHFLVPLHIEPWNMVGDFFRHVSDFDS